MNYDDMSDFEVNGLLASMIRGGGCYNLIESSQVVMIWNGNNKCGNWSDFDPCNKPSDTWPLIVGHELHLDPRRTSPKLGWMVSVNDRCWAVDKNPLRAAAICIIMKLEGDQ